MLLSYPSKNDQRLRFHISIWDYIYIELYLTRKANSKGTFKIYFTNHGNGHPGQLTATGNFDNAFHTFTYEWTPGKLDFQINGVEKGHITKNAPNFPIWFGIAIGSGDTFTGKPDSSTHLPVSYDIDWVHVYRYTDKQIKAV